MALRLYEQNETEFNHNGIHILNPSSLTITRSLKDYHYFMEFNYPLFVDEKWKDLIEYRILRFNDDRFDEYFRIKTIKKTNTEIYVYAEHIFFDLNANFIEDTNIVDKDGYQAIDQLLSRTQYGHNFKGTSDITTVNSARIVRCNVLNALLGDEENSFVNRWGGELDISKFTFEMNKQIGQNRGYKISYGKNLTSIECDLDMTNVVTRIMPYGFDGIMLPEKYVDSRYIENYALPIIQKIEYSDVKWKGSENYSESENDGAFETLEEARRELRRRANCEFDENKIDLPETTFYVDFVELSKTEEYKEFIQLLLLDIGDTVTIRHKKLELDLQARVMEYEYNGLTGKFNNIVLGSYKKTFFNELSKKNKTLEKLPETLSNFLDDAKKNASDLIDSALGGYVVKTPNELLIMDDPDMNIAQKVWRWNVNGLGYSDTGYHGTYKIGITMDGSIVADFINTGTLKAELIKSGYLESFNGSSRINMETGNFSFADERLTYYGNDKLVLDNPDGDTRLVLSSKGLFVNDKEKDKNLLSVKNGDLTAEGTIATGTEGKYIEVSDSDYKIYNGNKLVGFLGLRSNDIWTDSPKLFLGQEGISGTSNPYFSISSYKENENPQSYPSAYTDIAQFCTKDYSNIKMYSDGIIRISPVKELDITTNMTDGVYSGTGEKQLAKFTSSKSAHYDKNLQIEAISNRLNGYGLVLEDQRSTGLAKVHIQCDNNGNKHFRPLENGTHWLGSPNFKWRVVYADNGTIQTSDGRYKYVLEYVNDKSCYDMIRNTPVVGYSRLNKRIDKYESIQEISEELQQTSNEDSNIHMGIIAQNIEGTELAKYILVHDNLENGEDVYSVDLYAFSSSIMGALKFDIQERERLERKVKAQQKQIDEQQKQIDLLNKKMEKLLSLLEDDKE